MFMVIYLWENIYDGQRVMERIYIYIYIYSIDNNKYSFASFLILYERDHVLCLLWFAHLFRILFVRLIHMHVAR